MKERATLSNLDVDKLAGLVLELAQQLHVERAQRLALERVLIDKGVLTHAAIERLAADPAFTDALRRELDQSIRKLLRVLHERDDRRTPLRE